MPLDRNQKIKLSPPNKSPKMKPQTKQFFKKKARKTIEVMTTEESFTEVVSTPNPLSENKRASIKEASEATKKWSPKNLFQ